MILDMYFKPSSGDTEIVAEREFLQKTTFKDKFEVVWNFRAPDILETHEKEDKTIADSIHWRTTGNNKYKNSRNKDYLSKSIEAYTKSIAFAPVGSSELSLAYANRSAALFKARLYQDCLLDIERAIKAGYPDHLKTKLFIRQSLCFKALNPNSRLEGCISNANAIQWLPDLLKSYPNYNLEGEYLKMMNQLEKPPGGLIELKRKVDNVKDNDEMILTNGILDVNTIDNFNRLDYLKATSIDCSFEITITVVWIVTFFGEEKDLVWLHVNIPFCKLIKKSCDPNVYWVFSDSNVGFYASKPIKQGEPILLSVVSSYHLTTKANRNLVIGLMDDDAAPCKCTACVENWPTISSLPSYESMKLPIGIKKEMSRMMLKFEIMWQFINERAPDSHCDYLTEEKTVADSLSWRTTGNNEYKNSTNENYLSKSIKAYTKSIAYAPLGSSELSLAYANRSAALFKARLYQDCLLDIERALKSGYPDELKTKLFLRQALSFKALDRSFNIKLSDSMANAKKWLPNLKKNCPYYNIKAECSKMMNQLGEPLDTNTKVQHHPENDWQFQLTIKILSKALKAAGGIAQLKQKIDDVDSMEDKSMIYTDGIFNVNTIDNFHRLKYDKSAFDHCSFEQTTHIVSLVLMFGLNTNFFGQKMEVDDTCSNEDPLALGFLIARYFMIVNYNVVYLQGEENDLVWLHVNIPFCKIIKKSCDPNVYWVFSDSKVGFYASKPIKQGEPILLNVVSSYHLTTKVDRYTVIGLTNDDPVPCKCTACVENWPTIDFLPSFQSFKLSKKVRKELDRMVTKSRDYFKIIAEADPEKLLEIKDTYAELTDQVYQYVTVPCQELEAFQNMLAKMDGRNCVHDGDCRNISPSEQTTQLTNEDFMKKKTFKDKFIVAWNFMINYTHGKQFLFEKNAGDSIRWRTVGNQIYTSTIAKITNDYLSKSIEAYTKSIAYAPLGSNELSLAYANRSAVLFKARLYEDCLLDIERSLKIGYPDKLKTKLFLRQSLCFKALKPASGLEPCISMANAMQWLPNLKKINPKYDIIKEYPKLMNELDEPPTAGGLVELKEKINKIDSMKDKRMIMTNGKLDFNTIDNFLRLDFWKPTSEFCTYTYGSLAVMTVAIFGFQTNVLGKNNTVKEIYANDKAIILGELVMRYLMAAQYNCSFFSGKIPTILEPGSLGVVQPIHNLFKHSCDANVGGISYAAGTILGYLVEKPIKKGKLITDNSGMRYEEFPKSMRLDGVKRSPDGIKLPCDCRACVENLPMLLSLPSYQSLDLPRTIKLELSLLEVMAHQWDDVFNKKDRKKMLEIKDSWSQMTNTFHQHISVPCRETSEFSMYLALIYRQIGITPSILN
ncbi:hypothetical protein HCN44_002306 [Aphidius gifuensis]|uniref:Uncharacterized protein n=1 Tax=Aphidius gifuensis TaxID=684658 RepID=A0A834XZR6_APHGI|nr:hypothetical protein HCN44_002306 [Aphidius gifuensis]